MQPMLNVRDSFSRCIRLLLLGSKLGYGFHTLHFRTIGCEKKLRVRKKPQKITIDRALEPRCDVAIFDTFSGSGRFCADDGELGDLAGFVHCENQQFSMGQRIGLSDRSLELPHSKRKVSPQDSPFINVNVEYEVPGWCRKFDCTREQLESAVQKVGISAQAVAAELFRVKHEVVCDAFRRSLLTLSAETKKKMPAAKNKAYLQTSRNDLKQSESV